MIQLLYHLRAIHEYTMDSQADTQREYRGCRMFKKNEFVSLNDFDIDPHGVLLRYTGVEKEIVLPETVRIIGPTVFGTRFNYKYVEKVTVPEGVTTIMNNAFSDSRIREIILPSTLVSIGEEAFKNCERLHSVTIPDGVTEICDGTFRGCGLEEIHLPKQLKQIGMDAFYDCRYLQKINLPETDLPEVGYRAFSGCTGLVDGSGLFIYRNRLFVFYKEREEDLYGVTDVVIPDHVTHVEDEAFSNCGPVRITMPVDCPSWNVKGTAKYFGFAESIITEDASSLLFRGPDGRITAKIVLSFLDETEPVANGFVLSIRVKETGGFDFAAYDRYFFELTEEYNRRQMALARIRYPYELSSEMEEAYTAFLKEDAVDAGNQLIDENDQETMRILMERKLLDAEAVEFLLDYAQEKGLHDFVVNLLDYQNKEFGVNDVFGSLQFPEEPTENGGESGSESV